MIIVSGALVRTTANLNLRATPGGKQVSATLQSGAIVQALGKPVDGWLRVVCHGHTQDGVRLYSDPDTSATLKAIVHGAAAPGDWREIDMQGAVAVEFLAIVDGIVSST
jgi:hypothetical protein